MNQKEILKEILRDLAPMINGRWLVADGAMLGLTRDKDLIPHDNDIDIYLLPRSSINIPENSKYKIQKYYFNDKFYDSTKPRAKLNKWLEYISYSRVLPENKGLNRIKLIQKIKDKYINDSIGAEFTEPNIDIFYLQDNPALHRFEIPIWSQTHNYHFSYNELEVIVANTDLGFMIPLPTKEKCEQILERQYGIDWRKPDPNFRY